MKTKTTRMMMTNKKSRLGRGDKKQYLFSAIIPCGRIKENRR
ncbi:hypothetical protein B4092_3190 [Bacillus licheniformis]|nr:hypothetical protein B4092_3190 [Bacillus licheniformis]TWK53094.1 hypothetical protein CHCC20345_3095 [Bacillus licheniformis]